MTFQFDTNSNPATGAVCMYKLIATLIAAGWTKTRDSDGTTYSAVGAQVTSGAAGANGLGNANAWVVLQAPAVGGQQRSICFQRGGTNLVWRWKYSYAAGFIGGAPDAVTVPSAADELVKYGGGTDGAPTFQQTIGNDGAMRFNCCAGDLTVGYAFWWNAFPTGNAATTHYGMLLEIMSPASYPSPDDLDPAVLYAVTANGTTTAFGTDLFQTTATVHGLFNNGGTPVFKVAPPGVYYNPATGFYIAPAYTPGFGTGQNSWTAKDDGVPMLYGRAAGGATAPYGQKGYGRMAKWATVYRANYDTNDVASAGAKDWLFINGILLPWDGSTPII